ncbi:hypothetical protein [Clostridium sp.]
MGRIWMPGGGGGADLDVVTAEAKDVLAGKVIVDKDGNPLSGTMQTMSGGTYTPSTSQQRISCAEKKMTGDIIIPGFALPPADCIISGKSVTIYGKTVVGTAPHFVNSPSIIFNAGTWGSGLDKGGTVNSGEAIVNSTVFRFTGTTDGYMRTNCAVNLTPYKYLKINCTRHPYNSGKLSEFLCVSSSPNFTGFVANSATLAGYSDATLVSDVTSLSGMYFIYLHMSSSHPYAYIDINSIVLSNS